MNAPHHNQKTRYTHYSYLSGPNGMRQPTGLYDLAAACEETRRRLIHGLVNNGELLSLCPFAGEIQNMKQLVGALRWMEDEKARVKFTNPDLGQDWDDPRR